MKLYLHNNKEKWIDKRSKEQIKASNKKKYANMSPEALTKKNKQKKEHRLAIKLNGLTEKDYYGFKEKLIQDRGNKCEICNINRKEKRLILHHKKHYYPDYRLLINTSNCLILCDKHHRRIHLTS